MRALSLLLGSMIAASAAHAQQAGEPTSEVPIAEALPDTPLVSEMPPPRATDHPRTELGSPTRVEGPSAIEPAPAARRRIRTFELTIPFSIGLVGALFGSAAHGDVGTGALGLAFYGRVAPWASLGARLLLFDLGASGSDVTVAGGISLPSVRFSFREELDSIVAIECGVHVEGGYFGGTHHSPFGSGAFGLGGGFDVALDLGPSNAIVLDAVLEGWGAHGGYSAWLLLSLGYAVRFD